MPNWLRISRNILGLALIFLAFMGLTVMFNGTIRPDLYALVAEALWSLGGLLAMKRIVMPPRRSINSPFAFPGLSLLRVAAFAAGAAHPAPNRSA